ncbi:Ig-like domain-containing protein, partial [Candidatus Uhrbacteria bacterium]|nr:Ig-like domain-containing protein [Candidatus Uhrbacteria bacterium]
MSKQLVGAAKRGWVFILIAAVGFAFLAIISQPETAGAVAPTFSVQSWKNGQAVLSLQFSQPVNNGSNGALEASDFNVSGANSIAIASVSHTLNSPNVVLTLVGNLNSTNADFSIACATGAVFNQPFPPASAEACGTTPVAVYGTPEDTVGPQVIGVNVNSTTQVIVDFNERLSQATAIAGNFTLTTSAPADNSTITSVNYFGNGVELVASGATIATGSGNTVAVTSSVMDVVGNAATPTTVTLMPSIKISEVKLGSSTNAQDEFVELYNPSMTAFSVGTTSSPVLRLHLWNGATTTDTNVALTILTSSIQPNGYFLIASTMYSGSVAANATYNGSLAQLVSNGAVYISLSAQANTDVVDKLGWGSSTVNEAAAVTPDLVLGSSLERKASAFATPTSMATSGEHVSSGNSYDTNNNASDFVLMSSPNPQNTSSSPEFAGSFGNNQQSGDTTPATVIDSFPNAASVAANAVPVDLAMVGVDFSEAMSASTITTTTVRVTRDSAPGTNLCATVTYNPSATTGADTICTITTLPLLAVAHTLTVTTGATDIAGNPLASNFTLSFTPNASMTSASAAPPTVVGGYPNGGSTSVPSNASQFSVNFSRSMATASFTAANITLFNVTANAAVTLVNGNFSARTIMLSNDSVDIDVSGVVFTPGSAYRLTVGTGVTSSDAVALASPFIINFTIASGVDATGPLVIGREPATSATGVPVGNVVILATTDDALLASTVTTTSALLLVGSDQVPASVIYNSDFREIQLTANNVLSPNTTYTVRLLAAGSASPIQNVSGVSLQDNDGTANNRYEWSFTTGGADSTAPQVSFATATESSVNVTFTEPVNSSQVTNVANWTLQSPISTSVPLSSLGGNTITYDSVDMTATLNGVSLTEGNTFTVTLSGVSDMAGNTINPSVNSGSGVVMDESSGVQSGPGATFSGNTWDNPTGFTSFAFVPQPAIMLGSPVVSATSNVSVDVPITQQIRSSANSGKLILTFPQGFDVTNVVAMTGSPANSDINGPGPGTVGISSVVANVSARTVTIQPTIATRCAAGSTDPCMVGEENDFLHIDLSGIVNPSSPRGPDTSGYTVAITTMAGSTLQESLTSMPFYINAAGDNSLVVTFTAGSANAGTLTAYLGSPMSGQVSATSTTFSGGTATATFSGLNDGNYMLSTDAFVTLDSTQFVGIPNPMPIWVDGAETASVTLTSAASLTAVTVNVSGATGKNVDVFAGGSSGFTVQEIASTDGSDDVTLRLGNGTWFIGVGPHMEMGTGTFVQPTSPDYVVSSPLEVTVSGATVTETSGTANDGTVLFTLTAATNTLPVLVQNTSDLPVADAMIYANSVTGGFSTFAPAGINGTATLAITPGSYRVGAFLFGAPPPPETSVVVDASGNIYVGGSTVATLQVVIEISLPTTVITGQVTDGTNAVQGASVYTFCTANCGGSTNAGSMTDANGNYTLYVGNGTYSVRAFIPGYGELPAQTVIVSGSDQSGINFSAGSVTFRTVTGTVCIKAGGGSSCSGGTPITNAFVTVQNGTNFNQTPVNSSGVYTINVPAGSGYVVEARSPSYGNLPLVTGVNTTSANQTGIDVVMDTPNTITVNVKNAAGTLTSVNDLFIELVNTTTGTRANTYLASGSSTTLSVPSGSYRVEAMTQMFRFGSSSIQSDSGSTTIASSILTVDGSETIKLVLPTLRTITGTLSTTSGAVADAWVEVSNASTHVGDSTDSLGAFSIQLPDGTYQMTAYKYGMFVEPITLIVSASATQNLTGSITNRSISGSVTVGGSAATSGFVSAVRTGGGEMGVPVNPDGTYALSVSDGTWTLTGIAPGYAAVTLSSITVSSGSPTSSNNTIALVSTVSLANPRTQTITPSSGGVFDDDTLGVSVTAGEGALSTSDSAGSLAVEETNAVTDTGSTDVIGNGFDISFTDGGGTNVTDFALPVTIEIVLTVAELSAEGVDTLTEVNELGMSYRDSTGAWIGEATTITFLDAEGDVVASPAENLSNVTSVRFTIAVDHATVFSITAPADGVAPAAPTGVSATTNAAPIVVSWTAVTTNVDSSPITDLVGYEVYRDTSSGGSFSTQVNTSDVTGTSFTDDTASVGTTYFYKVTAADTGGQESAMSSAASGLRLAAGGSSGGGGGASTVTVISDSMTLTAPNGGNTVNGGSSVAITWTSAGNINNIVLSYSADGGKTYSTIVSGTANDGSHTWSVPNTATSQARVKIVGRDAGGATLATDTSDSNFIIA